MVFSSFWSSSILILFIILLISIIILLILFTVLLILIIVLLILIFFYHVLTSFLPVTVWIHVKSLTLDSYLDSLLLLGITKLTHWSDLIVYWLSVCLEMLSNKVAHDSKTIITTVTLVHMHQRLISKFLATQKVLKFHITSFLPLCRH